MQISCPHCHGILEVQESWAGLEVACPLCEGKLVVPGAVPPNNPLPAHGNKRSPANSKKNTKLQAWNRARRRRRIFSLLVLAVLIAGAVWGFNRWRGNTPPVEALRYWADYMIEWIGSRLTPARPTPAPTPAPTPSPTPEATPTPEPSPTPEPTPEEKDPVAWLNENPERRPATLLLREATSFPALYEGRVVGRVKVPAGTRVKLVGILPDGVTVRYREGTAKVAYDATNLRALAAEEMAKPAPEPSPQIAESPGPSPAAPVVAKVREQQLGVTLKKDKNGKAAGAVFRVWAPNAKTASVIGTFNNWKAQAGAMTLDEATGAWVAESPEAKPGDEYMFLFNGELERRDPRGRELSAEGKSVILDPAAFDWSEAPSPKQNLHDLVIYQLHPGTFFDPEPGDGAMATLRDAAAKLDYLKELGVNCVLLMPVAEFTGDHSWGYNPTDLYSIERAYGGPDALREFVKQAHLRGIAVHVDVVHNHYGPDELDLTGFDGYGGGDNGHGIYFYEDNERGSTPWGPRPDFGRAGVRSFIADQIRMLFDEYRVDGLRWDSVSNIVRYNDGASDNPDGEKLVDELSDMIRSEYPGKVSIAEDAVGDDRFDGSWEYGFHHAGENGESGVVPQLLRPPGETDVGDIASRLQSDLGFSRVIYTENHDETGRLNGKRRIIANADESDPHSLEARRKSALAAVLTLTAPGIPLVFMGQELLEDAEFHDSNPLDWARGDLSARSTALYRDLIRLRRNLDGRGAALQDTRIRIMEENADKKMLAYRRYLPGKPEDDIVVIANFSPDPVEKLPFTFPRAAKWKLLLDTDDPKYGADFTGAGTKPDAAGGNVVTVSLAPFSAQIFGIDR